MIEPTTWGMAPEHAEKLARMLEALSARPGNPHAVLVLESGDGSLSWSGAVLSSTSTLPGPWTRRPRARSRTASSRRSSACSPRR